MNELGAQMQAVMLQQEVPQSLLDWRRKTGADQWDEMWDGILHMVPPPLIGHQDLEGMLETWLRTFWAPRHGAKVFHQVALSQVREWQRDYRLPDLVLVLPERFHIIRKTHFAGGPDVAIEIRSPGDETYAKFPFYADLQTREIWVIDRDSRQPELHALHAGNYVRQSSGNDGWLSNGVGVQLRSEIAGSLTLQLADDDSTRRTFAAEESADEG